MARRAVLFGVGAVVVLTVAAGGVWWQQQRAAARARDHLLSVAAVELGRDPLDRSALVRVDRDLAARIASDPDPGLLRGRARIALALRMPDDALEHLDEAAFRGADDPADFALRARALAMRHALGGRVDDARQAARYALDHFTASSSPASALLAWQCATRIEDRELSDGIAEQIAAAAADSWENKVIQALRAFDPERPETGPPLRQLQLDGPPVPELDTALAALDVLASDEDTRARGVAAIKQVLTQVPSSKPARLVAVMAHDRLGDVAGRNAHLQWLIENFPQDERAQTWRDLALRQ